MTNGDDLVQKITEIHTDVKWIKEDRLNDKADIKKLESRVDLLESDRHHAGERRMAGSARIGVLRSHSIAISGDERCDYDHQPHRISD